MYAIAEVDCIDCFYDFELRTFGDGICSNNLLPSRELAEWLKDEMGCLMDAKVIEVELSFDDEGILFQYENIWGNAK
jgi:hypothetical protein